MFLGIFGGAVVGLLTGVELTWRILVLWGALIVGLPVLMFCVMYVILRRQ